VVVHVVRRQPAKASCLPSLCGHGTIRAVCAITLRINCL